MLIINANNTGRVFSFDSPGDNQTFALSGLTLSGGLADVAGGVMLESGDSLTISNSNIEDNIASPNSGGGIANLGGVLVISNTLVANNVATASGAGIMNTGVLTITNSTVSSNTAVGFGGGISLSSAAASLSLNNATITGNTAVSGNGGGVVTTGGFVSLRNTIVAGNNAGGVGPDCTGQLTSLGYNLIGNADFCAFAAATGDLVGFGGGEIDPQLGPLAFNGGSTPTHALSPTSPAIDQANPAGCIDGWGYLLTADQRGEVRPTDGDGDGVATCDIGAFEAGTFPSPDNNIIYLPLVLF